ncbi:acetyl-CoA carboxylase 1-like [Homarus americanus]|nr:acetyl-CoA carboxylase 1-like [Homarus americanus]
MEMYADPLSRGGVLEPEGLEIKFKKKDIVKAMSRLDSTIQILNQSLNEPDLPPEQQANIKKKIEKETRLITMYHQLTVTFADLHDTPVRMQEKTYLWDNDIAVAEWLDLQMEGHWSNEAGKSLPEEGSTSYLLENLQLMKRDAAISQVKDVIKEFPEIAMDTIVHIIRRMSPTQRADTLKALNNMDIVSQQAEPVTTPDPQENSN